MVRNFAGWPNEIPSSISTTKGISLADTIPRKTEPLRWPSGGNFTPTDHSLICQIETRALPASLES